jgi:hypothetical protein
MWKLISGGHTNWMGYSWRFLFCNLYLIHPIYFIPYSAIH